VQKKKLDDLRFYKFFGFISLCLILLLGEIAMTRQATAGWHYFSIFPLLGILLVMSLYIIVKALLPKRRLLVYSLVGAAILAFSLQQVYIYGKYADTYSKTPYNLIWSSAIYSLADYTKQHKNAQFMSLDWGTQTQLLGFDPVPGKYYEVFGPVVLSSPSLSQATYTEYVTDRSNAYYIAHAKGTQVDPEVERDFFKLVELHGYNPVQVKVIYDEKTPVFDIYRLVK
jgi:hypothetical protein